MRLLDRHEKRNQIQISDGIKLGLAKSQSQSCSSSSERSLAIFKDQKIGKNTTTLERQENEKDKDVPDNLDQTQRLNNGKKAKVRKFYNFMDMEQEFSSSRSSKSLKVGRYERQNLLKEPQIAKSRSKAYKMRSKHQDD